MTMTAPAKTTTDADGNVVETRTYVVDYKVETVLRVAVERPVDISKEDLLDSIDREDIVNGNCEATWDDVKYAWVNQNVDGIYDENVETELL